MDKIGSNFSGENLGGVRRIYEGCRVESHQTHPEFGATHLGGRVQRGSMPGVADNCGAASLQFVSTPHPVTPNSCTLVSATFGHATETGPVARAQADMGAPAANASRRWGALGKPLERGGCV